MNLQIPILSIQQKKKKKKKKKQKKKKKKKNNNHQNNVINIPINNESLSPNSVHRSKYDDTN